MKRFNEWFKVFTVAILIGGMISIINPFCQAVSASQSEYQVYSKQVDVKKDMIDKDTVCIPISIHLNHPATTKWECTVTVYGENNFSRTKTVDVFYSGQRGIAFSNNDFIEIKTNASIYKKPVEQLIYGRKYFYYCSWRKKGQKVYEYAESIPKSFVMPYPKLEIGNVKIENSKDGRFCLSAEALNTFDRGRIDWWFEIVCDADSCNAENCFMDSKVVVSNEKDIGMRGHYPVPKKNIGKQYRFRIVGYDYARNEKFESNWYFFKKIE